MLYCLDSCASVVCLPLPLPTALYQLLFIESSLLPYRELVLDQFVVSLIDLNLIRPQQSDLESFHRVNHDSCNAGRLLSGN